MWSRRLDWRCRADRVGCERKYLQGVEYALNYTIWYMVYYLKIPCLAQCEILVLDEPEFKEILMPYLMKVWVEKKRAIAALSYLKYMTNAQVGQRS